MTLLGLETPGFYWRPLGAAPRADAVRLDVPAFLGLSERGPLDRPVRVRSLREFEAHFGAPIDGGFLAFAVRAFFENGGDAVWIVRVASRDAAFGAQCAELIANASAAPGGQGAPYWRLRASTAGVWGNRLSVTIEQGSAAATRSLGGRRDADFLAVASLAGFERDGLVRLSQDGGSIVRPIADLDAANGRLLFLPADPARLRPWHQPLAGLDPAKPIVVERLSTTLVIRLGGRVSAVARDIAYAPDHPRYGPVLLADPAYPSQPENAAGEVSPFPIVIEALNDPGAELAPLLDSSGALLSLAGGRDGLAALQPSDFIGRASTPEEGARGLAALDLIDEPALIVAPDACIRPAPPPPYEFLPQPPFDPCAPCGAPASSPTLVTLPQPESPPEFSEDEIFSIQQAMVEHCEARADRIAALDPPWSAVADLTRAASALQDWRSRFDSNYAAIYAPWLLVVDPRDTRRTRAIPPSGHLAGQIARVDALNGPHWAPANRDLDFAQAANLAISPTLHGLFNTIGVNVIRVDQGRALRILGARLVTSDTALRDVPVRRVIILLRRSLTRLARNFVFEPNTQALRARFAQSVGVFMGNLYARGAFAGRSPQEAFAVRCDEANNTPAQRDNGQLICDVAFAPARPLEFIVMRIGVAGNEIEVSEKTVLAPGGLS
jgi:Bacteriophage tail sheath protein